LKAFIYIFRPIIRKEFPYSFLPFERFFEGLTGPFTTMMDGRWHLAGGCHRVGVSSITVAEPYGGDWEQYIYKASRSCKR
jgi:hypothetical protein